MARTAVLAATQHSEPFFAPRVVLVALAEQPLAVLLVPLERASRTLPTI